MGMLGLCNPKQCKLFCYCALCFVVAFYTIFSFETQHSVSQNLRTYTHGVETDEQTSGTSNEHFKGFHSQWGQDRYVAHYLTSLKSTTKQGIYIELGANDGLTHSNTAYFEQILSYDGLCVEPTEQNYKRLKINRPTCKSVHGGVHNQCPKSGTRDFLMFADPHSGLSGWVDTYAQDYEGAYVSTRETVPCYKMSTLLEDNGFSNREIDYLSLDTEGAELTVLKSMGFETACDSNDPQGTKPCKRRPKVIQVEVKRKYQESNVEQEKEMVLVKGELYEIEISIRDYLKSNGYSDQVREFTSPSIPDADKSVKTYDLIFIRTCDSL